MKSFLKFIVPGLIIVAILLAYLTNHSIFWVILIFFLIPFVFLYIITLNLKELRSRSRKDSVFFRSLLMVFALLSSATLIIHYSVSILHLPGGGIIKVWLFLVLIVSAIVAIFYYIWNFKKIDNYIASEYFVIVSPILIGISIAINSNWVDMKEYNELWKSLEEAKSINIKFDAIVNPDSLVSTHLIKLSKIQSTVINASGGYLESGYLANPLGTDVVATIFLTQGVLKSEIYSIIDVYSLDNNKFLNFDYSTKMTVADAIVGLELLKTAIYSSVLERNSRSDSLVRIFTIEEEF